MMEAQIRPDDVQRFAAAFALVEIHEPGATEALLANLNESDSYARLAAAAALTMLGHTNGLEVLRSYATSRELWERFAVVLALAHSNLPEGRELLASRLEDRVPAIRKLAAAAQTGPELYRKTVDFFSAPYLNGGNLL
jgi:HEAT repeat protein